MSLTDVGFSKLLDASDLYKALEWAEIMCAGKISIRIHVGDLFWKLCAHDRKKDRDKEKVGAVPGKSFKSNPSYCTGQQHGLGQNSTLFCFQLPHCTGDSMILIYLIGIARID